MNIEQSLALAPFNLSEDDIAWVKKVRDAIARCCVSGIKSIRIQLVVHASDRCKPRR